MDSDLSMGRGPRLVSPRQQSRMHVLRGGDPISQFEFLYKVLTQPRENLVAKLLAITSQSDTHAWVSFNVIEMAKSC
jgi:hypothetical protein